MHKRYLELQTLLIRLSATVQEELAVSDEVLHRLNNISLNGHGGVKAYRKMM